MEKLYPVKRHNLLAIEKVWLHIRLITTLLFIITLGLQANTTHHLPELPQAGKKTITGMVMDERGEAIIGANVVEKGTTNGMIKANKEGTYESPKSLADESSNSYWWHRITQYNNYYNKGIFTLHHDEYKIAKHNIFWPITQSNIDPNLYGRINQNYGYAGYEKNESPISSLTELEESGQ